MVEKKDLKKFFSFESYIRDGSLIDAGDLRKEVVKQVKHWISLLSDDKIFKGISKNFMVEVNTDYEETFKDLRLLGQLVAFISIFKITNEDLE